ncbi:zinc-ribbon domain-containing protein [Halogeometricum borinquense]|uniref:Zinc-ribbon domain-containing protein n=1 Tax=Halogeometricum borinquense TaxID=60847 RepID=A0A6C0UDP0_9EURY|nr:zinc ribbon domain-containing protein [Halogeometricum borinquense]QIB73484.1 zinc-ribbon domain-containing protein [Halogeometricum borinquense]
MYCSECGTEVEDGTSYCPDCGHQLEDPSVTTEREIEGESGECQKCGTKISTEVDRCPQCGYEPSSESILGSLFALICIPWVGIGALLYIAAFYALFTGGYTIGNFILGLGLITAFTAIPAFYLYGSYQRSQMGPTEQIELFGQEID